MYNQREENRRRVAKQNSQVYTRIVSKTVEIPVEQKVNHQVESPKLVQISEVLQVEKRKMFVRQILENMVNN